MNIELKKFTNDNIELTFDWIQDAELRRLFLMNGEPIWENHVKYFNSILNDYTQNVFAIFVDNNHIGNCGFKNIKESEAELWIYIGENAYKSKGLGKIACLKLIKEGIEKFNFDRIYLHLADFNVIAKNMYKSLGFIEIDLDDESKKIWGEKGIDIIKMEYKAGKG